MKKLVMFLILLLPVALFAASVPNKNDLSQLDTTYAKQEPTLAIGGTPSKSMLEQLNQRGVTVIIDTRTPREFDRQAQMKTIQSLQLRYYNIPIDGQNITNRQVQQLSILLNKHLDDGIYLHCASGNRASALWTLEKVKQGASLEEAINRAKNSGLSYGMEQYVRTRVKDLK